MIRGKSDKTNADQEYIFGDDSVLTLKHHTRRTAEKQAAWFLPYLRPGMALLDCGCGSGSITVGLAKAVEPGHVTGVDMLEKEIERARKRAAENNITNIRFVVGDIYQLDFSGNSFNALFSHNVLEHIPEPSRALQEMWRVLKPGGITGIRDVDFGGFILVPYNGIRDKFITLYEKDWRKYGGGDPRIGRHLGRLLYEAGFVEVKMSASYEIYSDPESRKFIVSIVNEHLSEIGFVNRVTTNGLTTIAELEEIKKAWLAWQEIPDAIWAHSHCEAVGRKS